MGRFEVREKQKRNKEATPPAEAELPEQARKTMEMETEKETERKITEPEP